MDIPTHDEAGPSQRAKNEGLQFNEGLGYNEEEDEDDIYGFSSEDEEWKVADGSESSSDSTSSGLVEEGTHQDHHSNDGLSDYQSSDECGFDSDVEVVSRKKMDLETKIKLGISKVHKHCMIGKEFVDGLPEIKLEEGMLFENVTKFREVLKDHAIQEGVRLVRLKNEKSRVTCICEAKGCPWRIHASCLSDKVTYQIKKLREPHNCVRIKVNKEATSCWIAKKMNDRFKETPTISIPSLFDAVHGRYGVNAHHMQLRRAKRKALDEIEGDHGVSYTFLPAYKNEIRKSNPGSLVTMQYHWPSPTAAPQFKRIFISFEAMISGFRDGCRPFIGLDGCHLKGTFGGVLMSAIGLDGNNGLFPLAFAVVETEGKESWSFFLDQLHTIIGVGTQERPWTFMSDMQKGLEVALSNVIPGAFHRRCCRHIFSNFKKKYPGLLLKKYFWKAARAYNVHDFQDAMNHIRELSNEAHKWLMNNAPVESWSRHAFDDRVHSDHVTNNITESFNNWVGEFRHKPILTMLEGIRGKLMTRIQMRYEKGCDWVGMVTPNIRKKLNKVMAESRRCIVANPGGEEYEVTDYGTVYVVHLGRKTCVCGVWKISGLPCKHAVAAICQNRHNLERFCHPCYTNHIYMKTYNYMIHPIPDRKMWDPVENELIESPTPRIPPGRPRKNRRREADEPAAGTSQVRRALTVRCKLCLQMGHNRRGCRRAPIASKQSQLGRGAANSSGRDNGRGIGTYSQPSPGTNASIGNGEGIETSSQPMPRANAARANVDRVKLHVQRGRGTTVRGGGSGHGVQNVDLGGLVQRASMVKANTSGAQSSA